MGVVIRQQRVSSRCDPDSARLGNRRRPRAPDSRSDHVWGSGRWRRSSDMSIDDTAGAVEASRLAATIRNSLYLFPLIESLHVIGLSMVFGTIAIIDLRRSASPRPRRPFTSIASDTLKWTWVAFVLTAVTGVLMLSPTPGLLRQLLLQGEDAADRQSPAINMFFFELTARRSVRGWDRDPSAPPAARAVAALSLVLWITIIFAGAGLASPQRRRRCPSIPNSHRGAAAAVGARRCRGLEAQFCGDALGYQYAGDRFRRPCRCARTPKRARLVPGVDRLERLAARPPADFSVM